MLPTSMYGVNPFALCARPIKILLPEPCRAQSHQFQLSEEMRRVLNYLLKQSSPQGGSYNKEVKTHLQ